MPVNTRVNLSITLSISISIFKLSFIHIQTRSVSIYLCLNIHIHTYPYLCNCNLRPSTKKPLTISNPTTRTNNRILSSAIPHPYALISPSWHCSSESSTCAWHPSTSAMHSPTSAPSNSTPSLRSLTSKATSQLTRACFKVASPSEVDWELWAVRSYSGSFPEGYFRLIPRNSLLAVNLFAFATGLLLLLPQFTVLFVARLGQGMCVGLYSALIPLLIK